MESENETPIDMAKMKESADKALAALLRRNRITQASYDTVKPVLDYAYNVIKDHTECGAGAFVFAKVMQSIIDIVGVMSAFEDHIEEHKTDTEKTADAVDKAIVERKDNVIHVDLTKNGSKN